jgi:hypothetical protein
LPVKIIGEQPRSEESIETLIVALAAVSVPASFALGADAAGYTPAHKRHAMGHYRRYTARNHGYKQQYPDENGWYPHDANKLAFGSALWWDQMRREDRIRR